MTQTYKPDLYILTETCLSGDRATSVIRTLGYERYIKVDDMGFTGGTWALWNPANILVEPITTAFHEIYLKVQVKTHTFLLTATRKTIWEKLAYFSDYINISWLIIGDFNEISSANKIFGGNPLSLQKMRVFNNFLNRAKLIDLGYTGPRFTWTNCSENGNIIRTRIDKAHATISWLNCFPETKITHLPRLTSDHYSILLKTHQSSFSGP